MIRLTGEKGPNMPKLLGASAYPLGVYCYSLVLTHLSNECKRRKLKCSSGLVCARCSRDQIPCVYATQRLPNKSIQETDLNDEGYVSSQIPSHIQSPFSID